MTTINATRAALALATAVTMLTSCFSPQDVLTDSEDLTEANSKQFTFHLKGDFVTEYTEMGETRAAVRLEDDNTAGMTDVWALDYVPVEGATGEYRLVQMVHQGKADQGFGTPQMALAYGHHEVCLITSKGDSPVLTATTGSTSTSGQPHRLSWTKVKDTFALLYSVDVTTSSNGNRAPELKRIVSGIKLVMTDVVPQDARDISITALRSLGLSLPSLTADAMAAHTVTLSIPDSWKGTSGKDAATYTLCPDNEMMTDVNIKVKSTDDKTISDFDVTGIALRPNRISNLTGQVFGRGSGFQISINGQWDDPLDVTF